MKKLLALLLAIIMCFSLIACTKVEMSEKDDDDDDKKEAKKDTSDETEDSDTPEALAVIESFLEAVSGDIEYGSCAVCGEDADEESFLCDDCMNSDVCLGCDEELDVAGSLLCDDCMEMMKEYGDTTSSNGSYDDYYEVNDSYEEYYS